MKYRKKPVTIDAVQWTGDNVAQVRALAGAKFHPLCIPKGEITAQVKDVLHDTWIGVKDGQWIIRGIQGELYPCDDDVFAATYEPVDDGVAPTDADRLWHLAHALGETKTRHGKPAMGWDGLLEKATRLQAWFTEYMRAVDAAEDVERARADR